MQQRIKQWIICLVGAWLLAACAPNSGSPARAGEVSDAASPRQAAEIIALAYQPADGSLLRADHNGLTRWRDGQWESVALPEAAPLTGVVVNPEEAQTLYVSGIGSGVFRSDNGGTSWQAVNTGLPSLEVTALALHSFKRAILYAWLKGDGIYRTEDGGATWTQLPDQGPGDKDVRGLVHSTLPGSMNTGWLYAATPSGAYLSMDCF